MKIARFLTLAAALALPSTALAQDVSGARPNLRSDGNLCTSALEIACRESRKPDALETAHHGFFSRFSRLAGMFMGRVDAAREGDFRFRFNLAIKKPPSSVDNHIALDDD